MSAKAPAKPPRKDRAARAQCAARHRVVVAPGVAAQRRTVGIRVRPDRRLERVLALGDALHGRGRLPRPDHHRRAGAAPHQPPRAQQEAGRHLLRAELRGHARGRLLAEEAGRRRPGAGREAGQGSLLQPHARGRGGGGRSTARCARSAWSTTSTSSATPTSARWRACCAPCRACTTRPRARRLAVSTMSDTSPTSAGSSGSTAAARSPTSSRAAPTARWSRTSCCPRTRSSTATPRSPASATCSGLSAGEPIPPAQVECVKMGTTVATNALLERKGEPTVLVITRGFRDALRIAYQNRPRIFDRHIVLPELLYSARDRGDERVGARRRGARAARRGAPARSELRAAYDAGPAQRGHRVHARLPLPAHEQAAAALAREVGFTQVSVSHEVSPLMKLVGARRHHGGRRLPVADPAPLRRAGGRASCRA